MADDGQFDAHVIRAKHYDETIKNLKADPIIQDMASDINPYIAKNELTHESGHARFEFMQLALAEYHKRGGEVQTHIGGPAEAILELVNDS